MIADSKYVGWINTLQGTARFIREVNGGPARKVEGCSERVQETVRETQELSGR